jgi:DNA polymerase elongation subunit (family B)
MKDLPVITPEVLRTFFEGRDPQKGIVNIEADYRRDTVEVISRVDGERRRDTFDFKPFLWSTDKGQRMLYGGNRDALLRKMKEYNIWCERLRTSRDGQKPDSRMENGYQLLWYARQKMSYTTFLTFFKEGGVDIYNSDKNFLALSPQEQFMTATGKRYFKSMDDYSQLKRMIVDIETEGLDPKTCRINQIGMWLSGVGHALLSLEGKTAQERDESEKKIIVKLIKTVNKVDPDVVAGHNSENFDWWFIIERCSILGISFSGITKQITGHAVYKKKRKSVLKLGGETEYFNQTVWYGINMIDALHACRRAQAGNSSIRNCNLKYMAEYSKVQKENRVFVPGENISGIWNDTDPYLFNEATGKWFKDDGKEHEGFRRTCGMEIVERYLTDDLEETDKIELIYNQPSFQITKILPMTYQRCATSGTAALWKSLCIAWSYENGLAIPMFGDNRNFVGGISRLLKTGYVRKIVKLDYNSLYPSITLDFNIVPSFDISNVFISLLTHMLMEREKYKGLEKESAKNVKKMKEHINEHPDDEEAKKELKKHQMYENLYNNIQTPDKKMCNGFFGSFGSPEVFPWGSVEKAEGITCRGRMAFRLMISYFTKRKFIPVVGDTDGLNFSYENVDLDYTYTGKGLNRNTLNGTVYTGIEAYVAEFNDYYFTDTAQRQSKMGLGIDEYAESTINISRKNYANLYENGKVKLTGNSIKSKKMPAYVEKFLDESMILLLTDRGSEFIDRYYNVIERLENANIPLKDIVSKGIIKKTLDEYDEEMKIPTKNGQTHARQAWYELAKKSKYRVNVGETVYYINTGSSENDGDVKKTPVYAMNPDGSYALKPRTDSNGNIIYSKVRGREHVPLKERVVKEFVYDLKCVMIEKDIIESDYPYTGYETDKFPKGISYNTKKYIKMFNSRVKPLLVCFHPDIRDKILIGSGEERKFFTREETRLCSGFPNRAQDQDSMENIFNMDDREITYWLSQEEVPVFVNNTGTDWPETVKKYMAYIEKIKEKEINREIKRFEEIIDRVKEYEIENYYDYGKAPFMDECEKFLSLNDNMEWISSKHKIKIGNMFEILDKVFTVREEEMKDDGFDSHKMKASKDMELSFAM